MSMVGGSHQTETVPQCVFSRSGVVQDRHNQETEGGTGQTALLGGQLRSEVLEPQRMQGLKAVCQVVHGQLQRLEGLNLCRTVCMHSMKYQGTKRRKRKTKHSINKMKNYLY